jgi:2-polyprenyl-3-methyl-5-hydroxy-6-metoxy-1,4-benzoquinol methylase
MSALSSRRESEQREHFDEFSSVLATEAEEFDFHSQRLFEAFFEISQPNSHDSILEVGCGTGRYTIPLLDRGLQLTALDLSEKCLEVLNERAQAQILDDNLRLKIGAIESLPTEPQFDLIFGIHFLHHCDDIQEVVDSVGQRIRPGGRTVFLEPNPFNPYWYPYIWLNGARQWQIEKGILKCRPTSLRSIFRKAGFKNIAIHTYGIVPIPLINRFQGLWKIEYFLNKLPCLRWISAVQLISGTKQ